MSPNERLFLCMVVSGYKIKICQCRADNMFQLPQVAKKNTMISPVSLLVVKSMHI